MSPDLVKAIEGYFGKSADELANTPLDELRREAEEKLGADLTFESRWPLIGRGTVLRGTRVLSAQAVDSRLDYALR